MEVICEAVAWAVAYVVGISAILAMFGLTDGE